MRDTLLLMEELRQEAGAGAEVEVKGEAFGGSAGLLASLEAQLAGQRAELHALFFGRPGDPNWGGLSQVALHVAA